jgi:hypothetical protein
MTEDHKIQLAALVRENKELLIGKFSPSVTQKARDQKWSQIYMHLTELGAVIHDVDTLRFVVFTNLPKATKRKRDKANSTGQGPPNYTELDNIILDIMGRDSAAARGISGDTQDDDVNLGQGEDEHDASSIMDETTESLFGGPLQTPVRVQLPGASAGGGGTFTVPQSVFARRSVPIFPATPRTTTSSPINSEVVDTAPSANTQQNSENQKKRPRAPLTSLLVDEQYKQLKVEKLHLDMEEQKLRMELIRVKIEAEKHRIEAESSRSNAEQQRSDFFRLAGLSLNGTHTMVISSENESSSVFHMQM